MADLGFVFNADDHEDRRDFGPIPAGDYSAEIIDSEMKPTKAGDTLYLKLTFKILDGDAEGRLYWENLNLNHANETPRKIAGQTLKEITQATGQISITDSEQLHFKPLRIKIGVKRRRDDPSQMENTARYEPLGDGAITISVKANPQPKAAPALDYRALAGKAPAPAAAPAAPAKKPWEIRK